MRQYQGANELPEMAFSWKPKFYLGDSAFARDWDGTGQFANMEVPRKMI
jgi:hypothetical protein